MFMLLSVCGFIARPAILCIIGWANIFLLDRWVNNFHLQKIFATEDPRLPAVAVVEVPVLQSLAEEETDDRVQSAGWQRVVKYKFESM